MAAPDTPRLIGRAGELDALAAAFAAGRHVLVEGPHGVGKSLLITEACRLSGSEPVVVHGSVGLGAPALVGSHDPAVVLSRGYGDGSFRPGPLVVAMAAGRVLYLDEANRAPADALNALVGAMSEAELVVPRYRRIVAAPGFRVAAAVNPLDWTGTSALPAAFSDRLVRLTLGYQSVQEERAILRSQAPGAQEALLTKAVYVVRASRRHPDVGIGSSVRGAVDLVAIAGRLRQLGAADAELDAALLALTSKIVLRPGIERSVESLIRELWADAVISERRASSHPRTADTTGEALPPSSVRLDREAGAGAPAAEAVGTPPRPGAGDDAPPPSGGSGASAPGTAAAGAGESEVVAETRQALASFVRSSSGGRSLSARMRLTTDPPQDTTDLERIAAGIVVTRTRGQLPTEDRTGGRFATVRYNYRSDDLDIDRTVAELVETPVPTYAQLWVHDRVPRRRGVVLMLDVSGSMRGGRAVESATATAAAALAAERDELAVVAFGSRAEVLKRTDESAPAHELVRRVLSLRPRGLTDLSAGLEAGLEQVAAMRSPVTIAVVMTDGVQNQGPDAVGAAARYRRLNVLATTDSAWRLRHCQALAAAGGGRCLRYERLDRLPGVLSALLSG